MAIMLNALGGYDPEATVSTAVVPAHTITDHAGVRHEPRRSYATVSSLCASARRFYPSVADAVEAMTADGWRVIAQGVDIAGQPCATLEHIETARALASRQAEVDREWQAARPCFVRYGRLPVGGRSRNHVDGYLEAGVSVYRGERLPDGRARALPRTNAEVAGCLQFAADDFDLYIVAGREIGAGSDGEPLLADARILRKARRA